MTLPVASCMTTCLLITFCANSGANTTTATNNTTSTWLSAPDDNLDNGKIPLDVQGAHSMVSPLRRQYNLQDFLWTGSGDGPEESSQDGGLAWEDNGGGGGGGGGDENVVRITKTSVVFRTVLSTIYPVEITPIVVLSSVSPTPLLVNIPSLTSSPSVSFPPVTDVYPSPTLTTPEPSLQIEENTPGLPPPEPTPYEPEDSNTITPEMDRLYWVQTVINANNSVVTSEPRFQGLMQKNLARIYASAFKRHLMSSLGILQNANKKVQNQNQEQDPSLRRRRSTTMIDFYEKEDADTEWLYPGHKLTPSKLRSLATAAMNVTVSILNITEVGRRPPHLSLNYVVCAEGNPVPAASAVQDLNLVTKQEMEKEIGYEVINKAEALMASPLKETKLEQATSPWLIVAITTIILMIFLLVVIMYMVWKWKHNRLSDTIITPARPQSGIEGGVVNPAFLGPPSPIERSGVAGEEHVQSLTTTFTSHKHVVEDKTRTSSRRGQQLEQQQLQAAALATELNTLLLQQSQLIPHHHPHPSSIKSSSNSSQESRKSRSKSGSRGGGKKVLTAKSRTPSPRKRRHKGEELSKRRRNKRRESEEEAEEEEESPTVSKKTEKSKSSRASDLFPGRVRVPSLEETLEQRGPDYGKSKQDQVSYGDLEVSQEAIARPISAKAKKLLPRVPVKEEGAAAAGSGEDGERRKGGGGGGKEVPETIDEISDMVTEDEEQKERGMEQDRDLSESLEHVDSLMEPPTKDAGVQTPTRRKPKPRPRKKSQPLSSAESLISTESEEVIQVTHLDGNESGDSNPMGRMRKRFHQFLDDAFNVMGKKEEETELPGRSKSAKVSISHQVETRESASRPWTSQVIREETLQQQRLRPKSASFGPPKRAWASSSGGIERRCHSAKSESSAANRSSRIQSGRRTATIPERGDESDYEESDLASTLVPPPLPTQPPPSSSHLGPVGSRVTLDPVFPNYPIYPDIPVVASSSRGIAAPRSSTTTTSSDPAVPLILAIKEEIKRFEKVKSSDQTPSDTPRSGT